MAIEWLICRHCMEVMPANNPVCRCILLQKPHLPKTQVLYVLELPEGYEIVKKPKPEETKS